MKKRKIKFGRAVIVQWHDSMSTSGWCYNTQAANIGETGKIQSIGYVFTCSPEALVITTSIGNKGGAIDCINIPWRSMEKLSILPEEFNR